MRKDYIKIAFKCPYCGSNDYHFQTIVGSQIMPKCKCGKCNMEIPHSVLLTMRVLEDDRRKL